MTAKINFETKPDQKYSVNYFNEHVYIESQSNPGKESITIYDLKGNKQVKPKLELTNNINCSSLSIGLYLVIIEENNKILYRYKFEKL